MIVELVCAYIRVFEFSSKIIRSYVLVIVCTLVFRLISIGTNFTAAGLPEKLTCVRLRHFRST